MSTCAHCQDADGFFNEKKARRERKHYRKKGGTGTTALLVEQLRKGDIQGKELLDVGSGIGATQHELFQDGLASATQVDASEGYLRASEAAAEERGHADRQRSFFGDLVDLSRELPPVELVSMDRVVCCYPYLEELLRTAASLTKERMALSYPKEMLLTRIGFPLVDFGLRLWGKSFQIYLHPRNEIHRILEEEGLQLRESKNNFLWHGETFERIAKKG